MELFVVRKEKKYLVGYLQARKWISYFSKILHQDENNRVDGYIVRSLYFDTIANDDYKDKEAGLEYRRKIRLRIYNPNQNSAKLEIKEKHGDAQRKRSLLLNKQQALQISKGDYSCLYSIPSELAQELYLILQLECYRPVCMIEYRRYAYILPENDIRITFDTYITGSESNLDLYALKPVYSPLQSSDNVVLEVKYNGFIVSYIKDTLQNIDRCETAMSKYMLGRTQLNL